MPTDKFPFLYHRATLMLDHCNRSGVEISAFWQGYVENVMLELSLLDDDIFSDRYYFASTFGGGTLGLGQGPDGIDLILTRFSRMMGKPFSQRIPWNIRSSAAFRHIFGRFFTLSVALRKTVERKNAAQKLHAQVVQLAFDNTREDVAKYDLKPRNYRSSDDVDILDPRSGENVHFSLNTLQKFRVLVYFQELTDAKGKIVVEIGSGVGEMARLYVALGLVRRYILVDIPPALAFSERHMVEEFGAAAVDSFDPDRSSVDMSDGRLVSVLTPDQLPLIPRADIGINEGSFGEMAPSIVERYVNDLKPANLQDFFSINPRLEKPSNTDKVGMNEYVCFFAPEMVLRTTKSYRRTSIFYEILDDKPDEIFYQLLHFQR